MSLSILHGSRGAPSRPGRVVARLMGVVLAACAAGVRPASLPVRSSVVTRLAAARNGSIRGRVELRRPPAPVERRPTVAELGGGATPDLPNLLRSVVYLEEAPRPAFEPNDDAHAIMDQRNETFVPHVLAITTGTVVDFPNSDKFYHNVFSLSKARRFDLGRYATGESKRITFDRPGIVRVFCEIHSHMNAYILVFNHRYFAVSDDEGRFHIDNIPPGTYSVVAWHEGTSAEPKSVTVPDGAAAELDFSIK
jgi:plastocyanin